MPESHSSIELPVFDISQPISPSCLSSLSLACNEWGFFHIINHGVSKDVYRKLYSLSNHIFSLPYESKVKVGPSSRVKTYTPPFSISILRKSSCFRTRFHYFGTKFYSNSPWPFKPWIQVINSHSLVTTVTWLSFFHLFNLLYSYYTLVTLCLHQ